MSDTSDRANIKIKYLGELLRLGLEGLPFGPEERKELVDRIGRVFYSIEEDLGIPRSLGE